MHRTLENQLEVEFGRSSFFFATFQKFNALTFSTCCVFCDEIEDPDWVIRLPFLSCKYSLAFELRGRLGEKVSFSLLSCLLEKKEDKNYSKSDPTS